LYSSTNRVVVKPSQKQFNAPKDADHSWSVEKHFKEDRFVLGKKKENANETALTGTTFANNDRKPRSGGSLPIS